MEVKIIVYFAELVQKCLAFLLYSDSLLIWYLQIWCHGVPKPWLIAKHYPTMVISHTFVYWFLRHTVLLPYFVSMQPLRFPLISVFLLLNQPRSREGHSHWKGVWVLGMCRGHDPLFSGHSPLHSLPIYRQCAALVTPVFIFLKNFAFSAIFLAKIQAL